MIIDRNRGPLAMPLFLLAPLIVACGDATVPEEPDPGGGAGGGVGGAGGGGGDAPFVPSVSWAPCPLDSRKSAGDDAECATVTVPADWEAPDGATVDLFVKRWPRGAAPLVDVWLVPGGPGYSGVEWEHRIPAVAEALPDARFYLADHRGTGRSSRLSCMAQEDDASDDGIVVSLDEWPACIAAVEQQWGELLPTFTVSNAARDLGALVDATHDDRRVVVVAQSYGTTLAQRYLHFFPEQSAVVLDSLANPGFTFTAYSEGVDAVGKQFLALCGEDAACAARVGPDPAALVEVAFAKAFDMAGCPGMEQTGIDRRLLAGALFVALLFPEYRPIVPAVVHRLDRCDAGDIAAFTHLAGALAAPAVPTLAERMFSPALYTHVVLSELWDDDPPTPEEHQGVLDQLEFGLLEVGLDSLLPTWPRYADDPLTDAFPHTSTPIAMFNGTLDPPTPLEHALAAKDAYAGPAQHFFVVPGASHGAIGGEPWSKPGPPCSVRLATAFVVDPEAAPDPSCFADVDSPGFEASAATSLAFFGTADAWGDSAAPGIVAPEVLAAAAAERERLAARFRALLRVH